ncbi:hypothetical protein EDD22DRAFT_921355 [Suillus occidentalis]|nr:hypothetical protein EDD22DRAFT_921355 [Suillus occidentalis]
MNLRQRQRWSLMTVLYLVVRTSCYAIAWLAVVLTPKLNMPVVSLTDACLILVRGNILSDAMNWTNVVIIAMLGGELQNLSDIDLTEGCCKSS